MNVDHFTGRQNNVFRLLHHNIYIYIYMYQQKFNLILDLSALKYYLVDESTGFY